MKDNNNCPLAVENNNSSLPTGELALLAKLEEANRLIESDAKSLNSLSGNSASGHSRKSSDTSQISLTSGMQNWTDRNSSEDISKEDLSEPCTCCETALAQLPHANTYEEKILQRAMSGLRRLHYITTQQINIRRNSLKGASSGHDRTDCAGPENAGGTTGSGEEDQWSLWSRIVADWEGYNASTKRKPSLVPGAGGGGSGAPCIKDLVRRGVPHHFRGIVWQLLCGAHDSPDKKQYAEYIKATSACEKVIRRDIARTYPEHDFFKEKDGLGQESLFNVMKAYSLHDREVGYCQGSGFIVGLLLMQMPEEEAFAVLVKIMQEHRMRDMFKPSMAELGLCMFQLESLVQDQIPELHVHFQSQGFHTSMYASSWFLTLFTTALSLPLACRVMDVFLSEGMEIIFKVALAMLGLAKADLLCLDMEGMLKFFQKELPPRAEADPEGLMNNAYNIKINTKKMRKLEKEYTVIKTKEQEEMIELRRLRNENRLLRQRNELLEAESAELADRLVRGQVSRAEEEETTYVVQRELAALRHTHLLTTHQLENAHEEIRALSLMLQDQHTSRQSSLDELSMKDESLKQKEEMVTCLQQELVKVRLREAENDALIRDLRGRINELEEDKKSLRESTPDNSVAHLQEELIAVKLREAEANLSLKDLRQRVQELAAQWQRHLQEHRQEPSPAPDSTPKKLLFWENRGNETQKLEEELMTTRIREMETLTELKELRLKVMELETQVQVSTNQMRRQDEENKRLKDDIETALTREKEQAAKAKEQAHRYTDLESRMKDEMMMAKIRDAEHAQHVAELMQKIGVLQMKNEEMVAEGELRCNLDDSDKVRELQDKVADLKAEVMRLESWKEHWVGGCVTPRVPSMRSSSWESDTLEPNDNLNDELHLQMPGVDQTTPTDV